MAFTQQAPTKRGAVGTFARRIVPRRADYPRGRDAWTLDLIAGLTVGVVALPLALGFGVASGVGPMPGLVTAIVAGFVAAIFGGSNVQVSGPTGAMTVVLVPMVAAFGPSVVPLLAVMAGCLVIVAGLMGLGRAVHLIPWPVVEGFTLGIAVIIFLQQVPLMLAVPGGGEGLRIVPSTVDVLRSTVWVDAVPTVSLAVVVMAVMVVARKLAPTFPGSLVGVAIATAASLLLQLDVPVIGQISVDDVAPGFALPEVAQLEVLVRAAVVVAFLAALESLLSARVADGMSDVDTTDPDRELVGQGLANVASGLLGGLPATGAIARTAVNVRSGARTRAASATHSIVLLIVLLVAGGLVRHVPLAALAGVLMLTAVRMVDPVTVRAVLASSRSDAAVFLVTAFVTIAFDLVLAVEVGVGIAVVLALRASAQLSGADVEHIDEHVEHIADDEVRRLLQEHVVVYRFQGSLFFGAAQRFVDVLADLDHARVVVLRLGAVHVLDATGAHVLVEAIHRLESHDTQVVLCGVRDEHRSALAALGIPGDALPADRMHRTLRSAIAQASELAADSAADLSP